MLFDEHYTDILMLDNHNTLLKTSRIEKICREFADSREDITYGGMEKFKYNPYNRKSSGSSTDRQVVFVYLNFKEKETLKMEDVLFDIYKHIISYIPTRALRELTICIVCRCNKSFDCSLYYNKNRLNKCNARISKDSEKPIYSNHQWNMWQYVSNNAIGSSEINRFFHGNQNGLTTGMYVMLMKTSTRLTDQKVKYYAGESWARYIQSETGR